MFLVCDFRRLAKYNSGATSSLKGGKERNKNLLQD
jgi:hypothetical protein